MLWLIEECASIQLCWAIHISFDDSTQMTPFRALSILVSRLRLLRAHVLAIVHSQRLRHLLAAWSDDGPSRLQALQQENTRLRAALEEAQQVWCLICVHPHRMQRRCADAACPLVRCGDGGTITCGQQCIRPRRVPSESRSVSSLWSGHPDHGLQML